MLYFCICPKLACRSCVYRGLEARLHILPPPLWLLMAWAIVWFPILYGPLPLGVMLCWIVSFSSFSLLFYSFLQSCYHFLLYHSAILAMMLFDPNLLGLFGPTAYSSLNDSIWSLSLMGLWVFNYLQICSYIYSIFFIIFVYHIYLCCCLYLDLYVVHFALSKK